MNGVAKHKSITKRLVFAVVDAEMQVAVSRNVLNTEIHRWFLGRHDGGERNFVRGKSSKLSRLHKGRQVSPNQ